MRTKHRKSKRTKFKRFKKKYQQEEFQFNTYRVGDVIQKKGLPAKGYILDDHMQAIDGQRFLILNKKMWQLLEIRYTPKELTFYGYETVGTLKPEKLERLRIEFVTGRKVKGSRMKREEQQDQLLKHALKETNTRKENRNEDQCKQQQPAKRSKRTKFKHRRSRRTK